MDKDIPIIDVIKADAMICVLNEMSDKSTQQDEDSNKDQKQNDNEIW
jgi:hypothetical protein